MAVLTTLHVHWYIKIPRDFHSESMSFRSRNVAEK